MTLMDDREWRKIKQPDPLDEDYILRNGDLFAVVATRAEYTGWAIYRRGTESHTIEYTQAGQLASGGYVPNIPQSAWIEVNEPNCSYYKLDDATLYAISEPMMNAAEDALRGLLT